MLKRLLLQINKATMFQIRNIDLNIELVQLKMINLYIMQMEAWI